MKRRTLLIGGAAAAVATALPALAMPSVAKIAAPNLDGFKAFLREYKESFFNPFGPGVFYGDLESEGEVFERLNFALIDKYPHLFDLGYMTKPVEIDEKGRTFVAKSRACKVQYNQHFVQDLKAICGLDPEKELENVIVTEIAGELRRERESGTPMKFYVPIFPVRFVDPETFVPAIGFKTRFADIREINAPEIAWVVPAGIKTMKVTV